MSFNELLAISQEAKQMRADDQAKPIVECPICGQLLDVNSRGVRNCPFGHFSQRGARRGPESV